MKSQNVEFALVVSNMEDPIDIEEKEKQKAEHEKNIAKIHKKILDNHDFTGVLKVSKRTLDRLKEEKKARNKIADDDE